MNALDAFQSMDLRVGRVLRAEFNPEAKTPSFKLWIDFGPLGEKTSSSHLVERYTPETVVGRLVIAAVNLGSRRVAGFVSEVLVMGLPDEDGHVVLLSVEREVPLGGRVY